MFFSQALKDAFTKLMTCSEEVYGEAVSQLAARLEKESKSRELSAKENLVVKLNEQYPKDIGVLAAFFLNLVSENTCANCQATPNILTGYRCGT